MLMLSVTFVQALPHEMNKQQYEKSDECTCGYRIDEVADDNDDDASFVHLTPSTSLLLENCNTSAMRNKSHDHLEDLLEIAISDNDQVSLCRDCLFRIQRALEKDTQRLYAETAVYRQGRDEELARRNEWRRLIGDENLRKESLEQELYHLQECCQQQQEELSQLRYMRRELKRVSQDLQNAEEHLNQDQNDFTLDALAFQNDQEQCQRILADLYEESEKLKSPNIRLPSLLVDIQVDRRGLRYPLLNGLRLASRPKGDIQWEELQAAWSLAAQLVLYVGTIFEFQCKHWRIVPLTSAAKLIFHQPKGGENGSNPKKNQTLVYDMGHPRTPSCQSLLAWNALLHQLATCVLSKMQRICAEGLIEEVPRLPFEMTSTKIGTIALRELHFSDDAGWSRALHCMSSNLFWMADCASLFLLHTSIPKSICRDVLM